MTYITGQGPDQLDWSWPCGWEVWINWSYRGPFHPVLFSDSMSTTIQYSYTTNDLHIFHTFEIFHACLSNDLFLVYNVKTLCLQNGVLSSIQTCPIFKNIFCEEIPDTSWWNWSTHGSFTCLNHKIRQLEKNNSFIWNRNTLPIGSSHLITEDVHEVLYKRICCWKFSQKISELSGID